MKDSDSIGKCYFCKTHVAGSTHCFLFLQEGLLKPTLDIFELLIIHVTFEYRFEDFRVIAFSVYELGENTDPANSCFCQILVGMGQSDLILMDGKVPLISW